MNKVDLFKSIGEIDDQTLFNAEVSKNRNANRIVVRLIAASLAIVLMVFGFSYLLPAETPGQSISSWFVITAQAAEGDWNELDLNEGYFNSGGTNQSIFPADTPLFNFVIKPSDWDNYENEYGKFEVVISYNGKKVESLDDHVVVFTAFPLYGSNDSYEYHVTGWFEKATDIDITIVDKSTGDVVEEITVNVNPQQGENVYMLTVTNVKTHDIK